MAESPHLIHCSYHKCLTVYFKRVMQGIFNRAQPWGRGYRHFNSHLDDFYANFRHLDVASVNNRALDLQRLGDFRLSRFIRDPRDLVVSGYFYHRRGAEPWVNDPRPSAESWYFANGQVPRGLQDRIADAETTAGNVADAPSGTSFAEYLQSLPQEEGLLAELEFRRYHLESMAAWPRQHADILTLRYEDILGHEVEAFHQVFEHYGLSTLQRSIGRWLVKKYALRKVSADPHVRNPSSGQWRQHFTPRVRQAFDSRYGALVRQLGYPAD